MLTNEKYTWSMRKFIVLSLSVALFALLSGAGFALVYEDKPKYDQVELIEYERCLDGISNALLIVADRPATRAKGYSWPEVLRNCLPYKPN